MTEVNQQHAEEKPETRILRPELRFEQVALKGRSLPVQQRRKIARALRTLHTLEIMAVNIYRRQITLEADSLNRELIAAMANEMTHVQDFQITLYAYGMRPSPFRWAWWCAGFAMGTGSRLLGIKAVLKTGIWVETKAVHHYSELMKAADWDEETLRILDKDRADEEGHIQTWKRMLQALNESTTQKGMP